MALILGCPNPCPVLSIGFDEFAGAAQQAVRVTLSHPESLLDTSSRQPPRMDRGERLRGEDKGAPRTLLNSEEPVKPEELAEAVRYMHSLLFDENASIEDKFDKYA